MYVLVRCVSGASPYYSNRISISRSSLRDNDLYPALLEGENEQDSAGSDNSDDLDDERSDDQYGGYSYAETSNNPDNLDKGSFFLTQDHETSSFPTVFNGLEDNNDNTFNGGIGISDEYSRQYNQNHTPALGDTEYPSYRPSTVGAELFPDPAPGDVNDDELELSDVSPDVTANSTARSSGSYPSSRREQADTAEHLESAPDLGIGERECNDDERERRNSNQTNRTDVSGQDEGAQTGKAFDALNELLSDANISRTRTNYGSLSSAHVNGPAADRR